MLALARKYQPEMARQLGATECFTGRGTRETYAWVLGQCGRSEKDIYQPELGKVISAGYRYNRNSVNETPTVDQIDISGQWPLSSRWSAVGRYNYSFLGSNQLLEAIAGVEYNAGCWAVRAVAQRLEAIAGSPNTTLFLQLELTDFGSIGSNPINLLRRSVPGYGKTNELATSSSLLTTQ